MLPEVARAGQADVYSMISTKARERQEAHALEDVEIIRTYGAL